LVLAKNTAGEVAAGGSGLGLGQMENWGIGMGILDIESPVVPWIVN